jgi:hypothetical protein
MLTIFLLKTVRLLTGRVPRVRADVGIINGKIAAIGKIRESAISSTLRAMSRSRFH